MQVIEELRRLGFEIEAAGDQVRVRHQSPPQPEALPLLQYVRKHKADVLAALNESQPSNEDAARADSTEEEADDLGGIVAEAPAIAPVLPAGLRLVSYVPPKPPIALEHCSIVTNLELFIQSSLAELEHKLNRPAIVSWGWSVPQLLDRLRQVGLVIEIDSVAAGEPGTNE